MFKMVNENFNVLIFSVDLVFINILKRIFEEIDKTPQITVFQSFSEAKTIPETKTINLILVDDLVTGTSSYELISFLRLHKKITCPMFYFGTSEYDGEHKALLIGANQFFEKPFKPEEIELTIKTTLQKVKMR